MIQECETMWSRRKIKKNYHRLLQTEQWLEYRTNMIEELGGACWSCGAEESLNIHHMRYIEGMFPWEYGSEHVRCYCQPCHETVSRICDDIWNECLRFEPHELELILKRLRNDKADSSPINLSFLSKLA